MHPGPGAAPVTKTFTFDPSLISDAQSFATVGLFLSNVYIGADLTAACEFAELDQPTLAKNMAQLMAADAENLAAFRTLLFLANASGVTPVATGPMASAIVQKAPNNASSTVAFSSYQSFGGTIVTPLPQPERLPGG